MAEIFAPKADDKFAAPLSEYALVKSSGYLNPIGVGEGALAMALAYSKHNGGRVIVTRVIGTADWFVVEQATAADGEVVIPDELPADFA